MPTITHYCPELPKRIGPPRDRDAHFVDAMSSTMHHLLLGVSVPDALHCSTMATAVPEDVFYSGLSGSYTLARSCAARIRLYVAAGMFESARHVWGEMLELR